MPRRRSQRWFALDVDGEPFHVKGDPAMDPQTREALVALARAMRAMFEQGSLPTTEEPMAEIKTITVSYSRTQSLGNYSNVRPGASLSAELAGDDDPTIVKAQLLAEARAFVEEVIDQALEREGEGAKFSTEPRYRLASTAEEIYRGGWNNRSKVTAPGKLLVLLPQRVNPHASDFPGRVWWSDLYGASVKLRLAHARTAAAEWLADPEHADYELIDCSDGNLSRIPEWALTTPPEPAPAQVFACAPEDLDDDDDEDEGDDDDEDEGDDDDA